MRVTNTGLTSSQIYQTQRNMQRMGKLNEQLNTGKIVNRASDDPYQARRIMSLKNEIGYTEKYNSNIDEVTGWLESTDSTLEKVSNTIDSLNQLIIGVGNGAYGDHEMKAIAEEIDEKIKQVGDALNNAYGDKYLMSGTELEEPPIIINDGPPASLEINPNISQADLNGRLNIEISDNIDIDYNLSVNDIFNGTDSNGNPINFLDSLNELSRVMNDIANGNNIDANKDRLVFGQDSLKTELNDFFKHTVNKRTEIGTNLQKIEKVKELNEHSILEMTKVLSVKQDTDYAEKLVEYITAEMIYQASLKVSSKLIQPTLMDFIR